MGAQGTLAFQHSDQARMDRVPTRPQGSETQAESRPQFLHIQCEVWQRPADLQVTSLSGLLLNTVIPNGALLSPCTRTSETQIKH